jgi:hypothetical protein
VDKFAASVYIGTASISSAADVVSLFHTVPDFDDMGCAGLLTVAITKTFDVQGRVIAFSEGRGGDAYWKFVEGMIVVDDCELRHGLDSVHMNCCTLSGAFRYYNCSAIVPRIVDWVLTFVKVALQLIV